MLDWLFSADGFVSRSAGGCEGWTAALGRLHQLGQMLIGLAYIAIPIVVLMVMRRARYRLYPWHRRMLGIMAMFVFLCGMNHVNAFVAYWHPWYWWEGVSLILTGIVSWAFVVYVWIVGPLVVDERAAIIARTRLSLEALERLNTPEAKDAIEAVKPLNDVIGEPRGRA